MLICHGLATRFLEDNREEKGARVLVDDRETKRERIRGGGEKQDTRMKGHSR